jgi:hypothetical protein
MKKVSVITVNYNQPLATEALLESIFNTNTYFSMEIIVVDNGSTVDPLNPWKLKYPAVNFIRSDSNLGFAGGINLGIREAIGDYIFIVNNDTEFTEELIDKLVETLDTNSNVGIVSPKVRYFDRPDILQYVGYTRMNYYTARAACIGQFEKDNGQYDNLTGETGFAHGAAMMITKEVIKKVGPLPEIYFACYEEMDWCEQIRKAGFEVWVNTQALIYHKGSISKGGNSTIKEYFMNRNRILFIRRNCPLKVRMIFWPYFLFVVATRNTFHYARDGKWNFIGVQFRAIMWNITNSIYSTRLGYDISRNANSDTE